MGTPDFAVASLKEIVENGHNVVAVITAPDKPAGRGRKLQQSAVKKYALSVNLPVLQPTNLKNTEFIDELKTYEANLQIVVAFRMLPEIVWNMPNLGTINLHGSLLPDYRGAAPINYAIINGEKKSGVTTFFIEKEIDTGKILFQEDVEIGENETAGELHDKLMELGAKLIVKTINLVFEGDFNPQSQKDILKGKEPKFAPKIFKETCKINWENNIEKIHNHIRGLSPYPAAWTEFAKPEDEKVLTVKIYESEKLIENHNYKTGTIISDNKKTLKIACKSGYIVVKILQISGKKRMKTHELLNGFDISDYFVKI